MLLMVSGACGVQEFGTIMSCKVLRDATSQVSRGVGFVQLSTPEEATKAISEMNLRMVCPSLPPSLRPFSQSSFHVLILVTTLYLLLRI